MEKSVFVPQRRSYAPPHIELLEIAVERGFAQSQDYNIFDDNYGTEKPGRDDIGDNWYFE